MVPAAFANILRYDFRSRWIVQHIALSLTPSTSRDMSSDDSKNSQSPTFRKTAASYLTKLAHGSAPFLSTFLMIHLSAPALANLGGSSLASQVMVCPPPSTNHQHVHIKSRPLQILGREYYKTSFGHHYLVVLPMLVHAASGITKRLCAPRTARKLSSGFVVAGYTSLFVFLPVHYLVHRVYPSNPAPPIFA